MIDLDQLDVRVCERTESPIPVHRFGSVLDVTPTQEIPGDRPIFILEARVRIAEDVPKSPMFPHRTSSGERPVDILLEVGEST